MDREAVIQYNRLLGQADEITSLYKGLWKKLGNAEARQHFYDTYMQWYLECLSILPDDVRPDIEKSYAISLGGMPSIQQMIELLLPNQDTPQAQPSYNKLISFPICFEEQVEALYIARRRIFTRRSQIPYQVRYALAEACKKIYQLWSIKKLFINNGCTYSWWIHPLKPLESDRMEKVMGWLDGIVLYAPEQELEIVTAVCEDILRKPQLSNTAQTEIIAILEAISTGAARTTPVNDAESQRASYTLDSALLSPLVPARQHLQELIESKTRRLRLLEKREAFQGVATDPTDLIEIEDLRGEISELEGKLQGSPT